MGEQPISSRLARARDAVLHGHWVSNETVVEVIGSRLEMKSGYPRSTPTIEAVNAD